MKKIARCEVCGMRRVLNRYDYCRECWKAQDMSTVYRDAEIIFTATYSLADILQAQSAIRGIWNLIGYRLHIDDCEDE